MPFLGQDWRSTGDHWIKVNDTWQLAKLRVFQPVPSDSIIINVSNHHQQSSTGGWSSFNGLIEEATMSPSSPYSGGGSPASQLTASAFGGRASTSPKGRRILISGGGGGAGGHRRHRPSSSSFSSSSPASSSSPSSLHNHNRNNIHHCPQIPATARTGVRGGVREDSGSGGDGTPRTVMAADGCQSSLLLEGDVFENDDIIDGDRDSRDDVRPPPIVPPSEFSDDEDIVDFTVSSQPDEEEEPPWQPHCFVKTGKSKEFVGCTSMSEAFHKLNLGREIGTVQRRNYIYKVVQILVREKLQNLSASARKVLLDVVGAIVMDSVVEYKEVNRVRELVEEFMGGLGRGIHCGSPSLLMAHQFTANNLHTLVSTTLPGTPGESSEDSVTFLDLPRECLRAILRRLPDHQSLLETAKASEALESMVEEEETLWRGLTAFHFTPTQIAAVKAPKDGQSVTAQIKRPIWRHYYFQLKKAHGLKESYGDMIHICCHCKALYWKDLGHPCVCLEAHPPSVRVTPSQFVDMLMFL